MIEPYIYIYICDDDCILRSPVSCMKYGSYRYTHAGRHDPKRRRSILSIGSLIEAISLEIWTPLDTVPFISVHTIESNDILENVLSIMPGLVSN